MKQSKSTFLTNIKEKYINESIITNKELILLYAKKTFIIKM
jgi:hypothetical protein